MNVTGVIIGISRPENSFMGPAIIIEPQIETFKEDASKEHYKAPGKK